jgi:hypothetical protein
VHSGTFQARGASGEKIADVVPSGSLYLLDVSTRFKVQDMCNMVLNCVRFGTIAGRERAVVGGKNGIVYFLELPAGANAEKPVQVCSFTREDGAITHSLC